MCSSDLGTDDTTAFQDAINAAGDWLTTHNEAMVYRPFPPNGIAWMIAGDLVNTDNANSQLCIPNPGTSKAKPVLRFYADVQDASEVPMWTQTAYAQIVNAVVSTGLFADGASYISNYDTYGKASVLGSTPSYANLDGNTDGLLNFANIYVVCENWTTVLPSNGSEIGRAHV